MGIVHNRFQIITCFGIRAEVRNKRMSRSGIGFTLSYQGPLYDGRDITKGLVRIDVSLRGERVPEDRITVRTEYDDVKTFIISAASLDYVFAEEVRALLVRSMARDLFDLWFLMERDIKPDLLLILAESSDNQYFIKNSMFLVGS